MREKSRPASGIALALLWTLLAAKGVVADTGKGVFTVDGRTTTLGYVRVFDFGETLQIFIGEQAMDGLTLTAIAEGDAAVLYVLVSKETGETDTMAEPGFVHEALGSDFMPESIVLQSRRQGERRYSGRVSAPQYTHGQHQVSFDASYEIELPDPCAAATVEMARGESEAAAAFGALYRKFTACDFEGMAEHLAPDVAETFLAELHGDQGAAAVEMLMTMMGQFPRAITLVEGSRDGDEATVRAEMGSETHEVTLQRVGGEWKVVSGFIF